ncbi:hypothetical protein Bca4012_002631 [Brassica carinata]|uniref:NYN domain-containing protein n=1 Tax=Brassica carinata TaxID=52824 RepID=A0A8X7RV39_BRACI|nr:hypothetical protein Bca52824_042612 [Brassica carinata]
MNESKIVDFSESVEVPKGLEGSEEGVFWDVEDFPFPVNSTPDEMYTKIESCLKEMEMDSVGTTRTTIWAYVDEKKNGTWGEGGGGEFLSKKTWDSRIYFLPGGDDKPSRRNRMFIDILLWQLDHLPPASLVVVSGGVRGDKEFFGRLPSLSMDSYAVDVIARPTHPVVPESAEWPRSLLAKSYSFDQSS